MTNLAPFPAQTTRTLRAQLEKLQALRLAQRSQSYLKSAKVIKLSKSKNNHAFRQAYSAAVVSSAGGVDKWPNP